MALRSAITYVYIYIYSRAPTRAHAVSRCSGATAAVDALCQEAVPAAHPAGRDGRM